jgi:peptidoglycan/xylan/chitin deacetylase (PgdA/CDA1 family)
MSNWTKLLLLGLIGLAVVLPGFVANFTETLNPVVTVDETTLPEDVPTHDITHLAGETLPEDVPTQPAPPSPPPPPSQIGTYQPEVSRCVGSAQRVNFSFDGGAGSHSIQAILETLKKHAVVGTFFVTGKWAEANPSWIKRAAEEGHEVFNHTYDHAPRNSAHPGLTNYTDEEIRVELRQANDIISGLIGRTTKPYFRPPYGDRNARVLAAAWSEGYRSIYWTVDALDWRAGETDDTVRNRILTRLTPGAIYLMHIGDDITGRILDGVLTEVKARGYSLVSLANCLK